MAELDAKWSVEGLYAVLGAGVDYCRSLLGTYQHYFENPGTEQTGLKVSYTEPLNPDVGAFIIGTGFWSPLCYNIIIIRNPQNSTGNYVGPYSKPPDPKAADPKPETQNFANLKP